MPLDERHILLVEDNPNDELLTIRTLRKNDISNKVVVARDGEEAISYLFKEACDGGGYENALPAVIFLDINLPKINGREVLRQIRAHDRTRCVPVVALTSSQEESDLIECYRSGINSYVQKPVDFSTFATVIKQIGEYWMFRNQTSAKENGPLYPDVKED